jgi:hypothetical protein
LIAPRSSCAFTRVWRCVAISSKSRCVYRLGPLDADEGEVPVEARWGLPDELELGRKRKAEGLTFADGDGALVALDTKDEHHNAYLLERLET